MVSPQNLGAGRGESPQTGAPGACSLLPGHGLPAGIEVPQGEGHIAAHGDDNGPLAAQPLDEKRRQEHGGQEHAAVEGAERRHTQAFLTVQAALWRDICPRGSAKHWAVQVSWPSLGTYWLNPKTLQEREMGSRSLSSVSLRAYRPLRGSDREVMKEQRGSFSHPRTTASCQVPEKGCDTQKTDGAGKIRVHMALE